MNKAKVKDNLKSGDAHYDYISGIIKDFIKRWNEQFTQQLKEFFIDDFKRVVFHYNWLYVDDLKLFFEFGIMGELGEYRRMNTQTLNLWLRNFQKKQYERLMRENPMGNKAEPGQTISMEQRRQTRDALIDVFMDFFDEYQKTKIYNPLMDHYIPVFYRWFKKLQYITSTEEQDVEIAKTEAMKLMDMRSFLSRKPDQKINTHKKIFIENFILATENNYPIEEQLKKMKL